MLLSRISVLLLTALAIEYNFVSNNIAKMNKYDRSSLRYKLRNLDLASCPEPIDIVEKCFDSFSVSINEMAYKLMIEELKKRGESAIAIYETIEKHADNFEEVYI